MSGRRRTSQLFVAVPLDIQAVAIVVARPQHDVESLAVPRHLAGVAGTRQGRSGLIFAQPLISPHLGADNRILPIATAAYVHGAALGPKADFNHSRTDPRLYLPTGGAIGRE